MLARMSDALTSWDLTDGIATLTLDDGKANALSHEMLDEIDVALTKAEAEADALVIAGRPGKFSAGFDLKVMMSGPANAAELVGKGAGVLLRAYELPLPVIGACTGHAVAGGALMLLCTDTRIGVEGDFKLGLNEVQIGMTMPLLAQELARDRLDPRRLTEATIQARMYAPAEAAEVGYLDRVVAPEALLATARETAVALAKLPKKAYGETKRRVRAKTIAEARASLKQDLAELTGLA